MTLLTWTVELHRILIPELLTNILSSLEAGRDLHATSQVCGLWSELSLDALWRSMWSVLPLLKVLGPMQESAEHEWVGLQAAEKNRQLE